MSDLEHTPHEPEQDSFPVFDLTPAQIGNFTDEPLNSLTRAVARDHSARRTPHLGHLACWRFFSRLELCARRC